MKLELREDELEALNWLIVRHVGEREWVDFEDGDKFHQAIRRVKKNIDALNELRFQKYWPKRSLFTNLLGKFLNIFVKVR